MKQYTILRTCVFFFEAVHTCLGPDTHTHSHLKDMGLANTAVSVKLSEAPLKQVQVPQDLEEGEQKISHDDCPSFVVLP